MQVDLFSVHVFFDVESESGIHFRRSELESLYNPEKKLKFPDYRRFPVPAFENGCRI